jgi:hypothetical protein
MKIVLHNKTLRNKWGPLATIVSGIQRERERLENGLGEEIPMP